MASSPVVAPTEVLSVAMCSDVLPVWAPDGLPEAICPEDQRFTKTVFFMRWAFDQQQLRQVHDIPEHTLVVGWREAKPCAEAIEALRTGDTSILRPDNKRAPVMPAGKTMAGKTIGMASTQGWGSSTTPIRRMIIMVNKGRHQNRALKLASELSETVEVHVVSSMEELTDALVGKEDDGASTASSEGGPAPFDPPPGLEGVCNFSGGIGATMEMLPPRKTMPPPAVPEGLAEAVGKWLQNVDLPTTGPLFALERVLPIPSKPAVHGMLSTEPLRVVIGPRLAV